MIEPGEGLLAALESWEAEIEDFSVRDTEELGTVVEPEGVDGDVLIEPESGGRRGSIEATGVVTDPSVTGESVCGEFGLVVAS